MTEEQIKLVRIGFNQAIKCMENHPEDSEFDTIYFNQAIEEAEKLLLLKVSQQRELLLAFKKWEAKKCKLPWDASPEQIIEQYLSQ